MFQDLEIDDFRQRTKMGRTTLNHGWSEAVVVTSLRNLTKVHSIQAMPQHYLHQLLINVVLEGDPDLAIYKDASIELGRVDPYTMQVGQTFVERDKYTKMLEDFSGFMEGFSLPHGPSKLTAVIVLGETASGQIALAHYLPPIIERRRRGMVLLDGTHRSFLVGRVGTTTEAIIISNIKVPFPCGTQSWRQVKVVEQKPPREERFINLQPALFRDLKFVGVDG